MGLLKGGGIALLAFILPWAICFGILLLPDAIAIYTGQQHGINWVIDHAYPNATLIRADSAVYDSPAGDNAAVSITAIFESSDTFDSIQYWYMHHPEGGRDGTEASDFPQGSLVRFDDTPSGKTRYSVP